jgi:hypothetical protein
VVKLEEEEVVVAAETLAGVEAAAGTPGEAAETLVAVAVAEGAAARQPPPAPGSPSSLYRSPTARSRSGQVRSPTPARR